MGGGVDVWGDLRRTCILGLRVSNSFLKASGEESGWRDWRGREWKSFKSGEGLVDWEGGGE